MAPDLTTVLATGTKVADATGDGPGASIFKAAASGAGLGATLGTVVPGVGNVIGAIAGAVGGLIFGIFKNKKKKAAAEAAKLETTNPTAAVDGKTTTGDVTAVAKPGFFKPGGLLDKLGIIGKTGKLTKGGTIGLIAAGATIIAGGLFFKHRKKKKAVAAKLAEAKLAEANKIDPPQTFNRSMGYDPFAGRQDYFSSPFVNQSGPTNQFAGFNRGYQGAYPPPPPPRVNPFGTRPAFGRQPVNPRMAQFNPNANFRPFA